MTEVKVAEPLYNTMDRDKELNVALYNLKHKTESNASAVPQENYIEIRKGFHKNNSSTTLVFYSIMSYRVLPSGLITTIIDPIFFASLYLHCS